MHSKLVGCESPVDRPSKRVVNMHNYARAAVAALLAVSIPLLPAGCTPNDKSTIVADASDSKIVAAMPSGDPSVEIRNVRLMRSRSGNDGYRRVEMNYRFVTGRHTEDTSLMVVIQHGSNKRSSGGSYNWKDGSDDISGTYLAPSDLPDLTSEESEFVWPTLKSIDVWLGVYDPDAPNRIRRVSQIVKVDIPSDSQRTSPSKHPQHNVYEERARHIGNTVKIHQVKWEGAEGNIPAGIQFDMSQNSEGIDDLDIEMELEIENKTKGYTWRVKGVFGIHVAIQRMTFLDKEWHPSQDIDVDDVLTARILSRRAIRWKDRRPEANEYVYRNRITESFNKRALTEYD